MSSITMINITQVIYILANQIRLDPFNKTNIQFLVNSFIETGFNPVKGCLTVAEYSIKNMEKAMTVFAEAVCAVFPKGFIYDGESKVTIDKDSLYSLFVSLKSNKQTYIGIDGYQRFASLIIANQVAKLLGKDSIKIIPAVIVPYVEKNCLFDAAYINIHRNDGVSNMSQKDMLFSAKKLFSKGCKENDIRKLFGDGMGQKLYSMLIIDSFAKTTYLDDCLKGSLAFSSIDKEAVRSLAKATKEKVNLKAIQAFYDHPKNVAPKVMSKKDIETLSNCGIQIVQDFIQGILKNNKDCLEKYSEYATKINAFISLLLTESNGPTIAPKRIIRRKVVEKPVEKPVEETVN